MRPIDIATDLRDLLDEATASEWSDATLWRLINRAYRYYCNEVAKRDAKYFTTSTTISLVADQEEYDLPRNCMQVLQVVDTDTTPDTPWLPTTFGERQEYQTSSVGAVNARKRWYPRNRKIGFTPIPDTATTDTIAVHHVFRPIDLHYGTMGSVVAGTSIVLGKTVTQGTCYAIADIYNGQWVEANDYRAEITDYSGATKVATVDFGTDPTADDTYYLMPLFPEEFWGLLSLRAAIFALGRVEDDTSQWWGILKEEEQAFYESINVRQLQEPRYVRTVGED